MKTDETLNILALIPAYNEAQRIGEVVAGARQYLPVLVVDDGSMDDTAAVASQSGARVLSQRPNQGKGAALTAGFRRAIAEGCAAVLTLDADGQHDPAEIPQFLQVYRERGVDLIIGGRDFSQIPPVRRAANTLGRWSFSWAVGRPVRDNQSGYRLISRRLMEAMLASQEQGFQFEVEMIVVCVQKGYALDWVPIRTIYAGESSHIQPLQHVIEFTRMVVQTRRRMKRIS
ncbi:MAG TPA: glycosyltransferase family 2 protein [Anaerolineales bacterium]|nr:glycosyltransferase family 2 protein [Anaerolineales bacterium]